jgi:hypothetical protein
MEWKPSKPGHISKTIKHGSAVVTIHRPDLNNAERKKREQTAVENLNNSLRVYLGNWSKAVE